MTDTYELPEPAAWLHQQGNHTEASDRQLDADELARGWTQERLYTADQVHAALKAERERCARLAEDMPITYERDGHYYNTVPEDYAAAIRKG